MTREEYINKVARKLKSIVYSSPYINSIRGAQLDDKTMIDKAIKFFQIKSKHGMIEENINDFIDEFRKAMYK